MKTALPYLILLSNSFSLTVTLYHCPQKSLPTLTSGQFSLHTSFYLYSNTVPSNIYSLTVELMVSVEFDLVLFAWVIIKAGITTRIITMVQTCSAIDNYISNTSKDWLCISPILSDSVFAGKHTHRGTLFFPSLGQQNCSSFLLTK